MNTDLPGLDNVATIAPPPAPTVAEVPMAERWVRGDRVTSTVLAIGTLLICSSAGFNAANLVEVTAHDSSGLNRSIFYGRFVNPNDPKSRRGGASDEFSVWDFELEKDQYHLAVLGDTRAAKPIEFA